MALLELTGTAQQASQLALYSTSPLPHEESKRGPWLADSHFYVPPGLVDMGLQEAFCPTRFFDSKRFEDPLLKPSSSSSWVFDTRSFSAPNTSVSSSLTSYNNHLYEYADSKIVLQGLCLSDKQGLLALPDIIFHLLRTITVKSDQCGGAQQLHFLMVSNGLDGCIIFCDRIVHLFASLGSLTEAFTIFRKISQPTAHSWHLLISGCIFAGELVLAFDLFEQMEQLGIWPNGSTFREVLKVCGNIRDFEYGQKIHDQVNRQGLASDVFIGSTLIDMYIKCGRLDEACRVFDGMPIRNAVAWNAMIGGYVKQGHGATALKLFNEMQLEGIKPDRITFLCILKACSLVGRTEHGILVHCHAVEGGLDLDVQVGTSLIDMYAKCGDFKDSCNVFQKLPCQDVVSWGAILAGCVQHRENRLGLTLFGKMQEEGIKPDIHTWSSAIQACGSLGALKKGKQLHEQVVRSGRLDVVVVSSLIEMYAKCGNLTVARQVLDSWPTSGITPWGAMIAGYAAHGNLSLARSSFEHMQKHSIVPNGVIYTSLLDACSHASQVKAGCDYFKEMKEKHGIVPGIEHFGCMVDLFGRAGVFDEAEELLELMPIAPDLKNWMSLLTGCRKYGNVKLARNCFNQVMRLNSGATAGYVLMMQVYARAHMWDNVKEIQRLKKYSNAWKEPGKAWIEVETKIHEFVVDDRNHPMLDKIHVLLESLRTRMEDEGLTAEAELAFEAVATGGNDEDALYGHCEKLAIAFGLLALPEGETIRVTKNLRMCGHCHTAGKVLSKIERRYIVVRDEYCVHHFKDGTCSCQESS